LQKVSCSKINEKFASVVICQLLCVSTLEENCLICRSCIGRLRTIDSNLSKMREMFAKNCSVKRMLSHTPTRISPPNKVSQHTAKTSGTDAVPRVRRTLLQSPKNVRRIVKSPNKVCSSSELLI
jgi:hypothetical protein